MGSQSHAERARGLLARMTLSEKVAQLCSLWVNIAEDGGLSFRQGGDGFIRDEAGDPLEVLRDGIGHLTRPLGTRPVEAARGLRGLNRVQKYLVERTRLGIPALAHEECLAGLLAKGATLFPAGINYGSLWDEGLMARIARAIGEELEDAGSRLGLAPVLDVCRDARWGRTEESFGEDPYLCGCLGLAYVTGLQDGGKASVLATLKHFAGHGFGEGGRNHAPVHIGERELSDVFLLPFEMAVKLGGARVLMPAYHDIDGEPISASRRYLTELLRGQWGFDGLVVSDYEAIRLLAEQHRVAADEAEASALALKAGIDVEMPGFAYLRAGVPKALARGLLDMATVDAAVTRVLVEKSRLGLFDNPYAEEGALSLGSEAHRRLAAEAAARSIVLLKNDGTLPLSGEGTTALVGPLADEQLAFFCSYSFPVHLIASLHTVDRQSRYARTLREALGGRLPEGRLLYSKGCEIFSERPTRTPVSPAELGERTEAGPLSLDASGFAAAVQAASRAERIIVAVGDLSGLFLTGTVGEGSDASSLSLPGVQQRLVERLLDTGKPVIVVLLNGRPYNLGEAFGRAAAVLEAWLPGQEGAEALAGILFGELNPGGRLPVSIPRCAGAMPYYYNHGLKSAGTPAQPEFGAVFPFGHGLSYTRFAYEEFAVEEAEVPVDGQLRVSCAVRNTGGRAGDEVVQLYARDLVASLVRPVQELKGFQRLSLEPGERKRVTFLLPTDLLGFSASATTRVVEPGEFELMLGRSSADICFRRVVRVTGRPRTLPCSWRMKTEVRVDPA
jgi:beta-xylosidase